MKTQEATTAAKKTTIAKSKTPKGAGKPAQKDAPAKAAKATKATKTTKAKPKAPKGNTRTGSKTAIILDLLRRKDGATLTDIAKATGWQNHSIRGFISGQVTKKMGLKVESTKNDAGERTYRIA